MSLSLLRIDILVELANLGERGSERVLSHVSNLLGKAPGTWLPDGFDSSRELLARAIRESTEEGRTVIMKALARVINELFSEAQMSALDDASSRRLLGALKLGVLYGGVPTQGIVSALQVARNAPHLFWSRVRPVEEIVGSTKRDQERFVELLCESLFSKGIGDGNGDPSQSGVLPFGRMIAIRMDVNGTQRLFGLKQATRKGLPFYFSQEAVSKEDVEVIRLDKEFRLNHPSPRILTNAAITHLKSKEHVFSVA